jgi:hypothetical protein
MGFVDVETREIHQAEFERLQSPFEQQNELLKVLGSAWHHNAEILTRYGYRVPSGSPFPWCGTPMKQDIQEPDAIEAFRVIDAVCGLWRAIWSKDTFAIANAAFWLGRMTGGDQFRQYNRRNSRKTRKSRSAPKSCAREFYQSRDHWEGGFQAFQKALCEADRTMIEVKETTIRKWWQDFEKKKPARP